LSLFPLTLAIALFTMRELLTKQLQSNNSLSKIN
jgi:hypothetical protein